MCTACSLSCSPVHVPKLIECDVALPAQANDRMIVLDSMHGSAALKGARDFADFIGRAMQDESLSARVQIIRPADYFTQSDGSSCGVFSAITILHLLTGAAINYPITQPHGMTDWRTYIAAKIWSLARAYASPA